MNAIQDKRWHNKCDICGAENKTICDTSFSGKVNLCVVHCSHHTEEEVFLKIYKYLSNRPLTNEDKKEITDAGWTFANEEYIYIPDDYDGCMASGISSIRKILDGIRKQKANK